MGALAPGFRFCPTDEELLIHYLRPKAWGKAFHQGTIAEVDIYKFEPWDLPDKSALFTKDPEWYFFSTQDKKYSHTARINRTTARGYWKATGKDRKVYSGPCVVGLKKTLIYYEGRAPNGRRTNWIMHEYRLDHESEKKEKGTSISVLCRIRKKGGPGPRNGEQYGAPIWNEVDETDDESKSGKLSISKDAVLLEGGTVKGGNAFDLQKQVENLRSSGRLGPVKVELGEVDSVVNSGRTLNKHGTAFTSKDEKIVCEKDSYDLSNSTFDVPFCELAPNTWEDSLSWYQPFTDFQDTGTRFDSESLPVLPTLTDFDGHNLQDYAIPAFDEPEILGEMWSLVSHGYCGPSSGVDNEMVAPQLIIDGCNRPAFDKPQILEDIYNSHCDTGSRDIDVAPQLTSKVLPGKISHVVGGDYIELDDIEAPLGDAFVNIRSATTGAVQDPVACQGSATRRVPLQVPASCRPEGMAKNVITSDHLVAAQTLTPQVPMHIHGGSKDIGIPITREIYTNNDVSIKDTKNKLSGFYCGANFKSCSTPHAVESSTRSYLSKHITSYAVSKFEIEPPQLCYASLTDSQDGLTEVIKKTNSSTDSFTKDECQIDTEKAEIVTLELCCESLIDIQDGSLKVHKECDSSTTVLIKGEKQIDEHSSGKRASSSLDATASTSLLTQDIIFEGKKAVGVAFKVRNSCKSCLAGNSPNSENALKQGPISEVKFADLSSSRRHRLRASLREIKNKLKQSALGVKVIQLEEGMRTKLSDRLHTHGKSADPIFASEDEINDFDRLRSGLLAILYYLATAAFILSCLFWGYHIVSKYASCVSVQ
ncbi:hypothetical protein L7F22_060862 [Adiantum nelumboides]|nr:hypothetical protein [Adiantum nelumboides]